MKYDGKEVSNTAEGFTLLELLIVITIISILFTLSVLAIRTHSPGDLIKEEALRLDRLIQLALEEAILRNIEYGIQFSPQGYQFLFYKGGQWQPMDEDRLLRPRELPREMEIELVMEERSVVIDKAGNASNDSDTKKLKPQVFLLSSEEITPEFSARFVIPNIDTSYVVSGKLNGTHKAEEDKL